MSAVDARSSHVCAATGHTSSHSRRNQIGGDVRSARCCAGYAV